MGRHGWLRQLPRDGRIVTARGAAAESFPTDRALYRAPDRPEVNVRLEILCIELRDIVTGGRLEASRAAHIGATDLSVVLAPSVAQIQPVWEIPNSWLWSGNVSTAAE